MHERATIRDMALLMLDNYDSFTYNLVQYLGELGATVEVVRNDVESVAELLARRPEGVVISPGPGRPAAAGVSVELVRAAGDLGDAALTLGSAEDVVEGGEAIVAARGGTAQAILAGEALDLRTQIGANQRGARMLLDLTERAGPDTLAQAIDDLLAYTRQRLANRIAALPDGAYTFRRDLDDDGYGGPTVPIVCTARVKGGQLTLDFSGSGPEARGAVNLPDSALKASVYYSVKAVLDPGLLPNQGMIDPIRIVSEPGTIVDPRPPAAVAARAVTSNRLCGAVFGALYQALPPEEGMASCNDSTSATSVSGWHPRRQTTYVYPESMGGGALGIFDQI